MSRGAMVISFDFELAWGLRTSSSDHSGYHGIERVREVVAGLLDIFQRLEIPATWATVGHLMLRSEDCPGGKFSYESPAPRYPWFSGDWFDGIPGVEEPLADQFYAPDLVERIVGCPVYQELATHTFSHVDMGDPASSRDLADAEFGLCRRLTESWGRTMRSVVFPHNYVGGDWTSLPNTELRRFAD